MENKNIIFQTNKRVIQVYETQYEGERCYCIEHIPTGHKEIIDYNDYVINAVVRKIMRTKSLTIDRKKNGYILKFNKRGREGNVSLRNYIFAKYNNVPLDTLKRAKIMLRDNSGREQNILDLRSNNLYNAGGYRYDGIEIISRPNKQEEKYIIVTTKEGNVSIQDYSKDLYEILITRSMCSKIQFNKKTGRHHLSIHYANNKNGYFINNLARFVLMYYEYFGKFQKQNGSKKRFIHAIASLSSSLGEDNDCGHINSKKWNNSRHNLAIMSKKSNMEMMNYANRFIGNYRVYPIVLHEEENTVLIEMVSFGKFFYYKCKSMEEYADFQRTMMGKSKLTASLQMRLVCKEGQFAHDVDTPGQVYKRNKSQVMTNTKDDILDEFWDWCNKRDELITLYQNSPKVFNEWNSCKDGTNINTLIRNVLPVMLASFME